MIEQVRVESQAVSRQKLSLPKKPEKPSAGDKKAGDAVDSQKHAATMPRAEDPARVRTRELIRNLADVVNAVTDVLEKTGGNLTEAVETVSRVHDALQVEAGDNSTIVALLEKMLVLLRRPDLSRAGREALQDMAATLREEEARLTRTLSLAPVAETDDQAVASPLSDETEGANLVALQLSLALSRNQDLSIADGDRRARILSLID